MALVTIAANGSVTEVVAAAGKGVVQVISGAIRIENAADPSAGLKLTQGQSLAVDGWTAAWNAETGITGRAATLYVASE